MGTNDYMSSKVLPRIPDANQVELKNNFGTLKDVDLLEKSEVFKDSGSREIATILEENRRLREENRKMKDKLTSVMEKSKEIQNLFKFFEAHINKNLIK